MVAAYMWPWLLKYSLASAYHGLRDVRFGEGFALELEFRFPFAFVLLLLQHVLRVFLTFFDALRTFLGIIKTIRGAIVVRDRIPGLFEKRQGLRIMGKLV